MLKLTRVLLALVILVGTCAGADAQSLIPGVEGRVFFLSNRTGANAIWVVDLDQGTTSAVSDLSQFHSAGDLSVSSDGTRLAFTALRANSWDFWSTEIFIINTDGTGLMQVTDWPSTPTANQPRWSPSDPDVLYYIYTWGYGPDRVRRLNVATGEDTPLEQGYGGATKGWDISNDETFAVMTREPGCCSHPNSFIVSQNLYDPLYAITKPSDGRSDSVQRVNREDGWVLFWEETEGTTGRINLFKMDPAGNQVTALTGYPGSGTLGGGVWAGGNHEGYIIFSTTWFGDEELVAMKADPSEWPSGLIRLTNSPGNDFNPAWTPIPSTPPDATPPVISSTVNGTLGENGWYTSDVSVSWSVSDPESDITSSSGCDSVTVTEDTAGATFTCTATSAGGTASESVTIKRDTTPPTVMCSATPDVLWPANHRLWDVTAIATASDANPWTLKGLEILSSEADSGLGPDDVPNDIQGFAAGTTTSGQLRAERYSKDGRTYTLTFTVADEAGNTGTCATSVIVPHDQGNGKGKNR